MNMDADTSQTSLLKTLSHPTRLAVLEILRGGEQCVCHMEARLGVRQASLSQQLMILRREGLVRVRRDGLNIFYRVARPQVFAVLDALSAAAPAAALRHVRNRGIAACPCPKCGAGHRGGGSRSRKPAVRARGVV